MRLHAYMCDRSCECVHACVANGMADSAPACAPAWQILADSAPPCAPAWQIMRLHACLCGRYCSACMPAWQIMHLYAHMCGRLRNYMRAWVAEATSTSEYGRLCNRMCGRACCCMCASIAANAVCACLCGRFCTCMHAYVAGTACVAANVTAGNCGQARVANCATACVRVCVADNAVPVWPIMPLHACLCGRWCSACMP